MTLRAPYLLFLSLLLISSGALAQEGGEETVRVEGEFFNGTLDQPGPVGLEVTLFTLGGESSQFQALGQTETAEGGRFSFSLTPSNELAHLVAVTNYQGVPYMGRVELETEGQRITIYEATPEMGDVVIENHEILVTLEGVDQERILGRGTGEYQEEDAPRLIFHEVLRLVNRGKTTYVGQDQTTLHLSLPPKAELFSSPEGLFPDALRRGPDGLVVSEPIPPGVREISFRYMIPDPPPQFAIEKRISLPTTRLAVMTPDILWAGMRLASEDLATRGVPLEIQGQRYHFLSAANLQPGRQVGFIVSRDVESTSFQPIFFILLAVLVGGLSIPYLVRRNRKRRAVKTAGRPPVQRPEVKKAQESAKAERRPAPPREAPKVQEKAKQESALEKREKVLVEIATLDNAHEAGRVSAEEYARRRRELSRRALELTKKLKGP